MNINKKYLLQIGLAFVFLYAGISSFIKPLDWIGFVPSWVSMFGVTRTVALHMHAVIEILLGLLFLTNFKIRFVAIIAAADLLAIISVNGFSPAIFTTTFRDVGLFFMALFLAIY